MRWGVSLLPLAHRLQDLSEGFQGLVQLGKEAVSPAGSCESTRGRPSRPEVLTVGGELMAADAVQVSQTGLPSGQSRRQKRWKKTTERSNGPCVVTIGEPLATYRMQHPKYPLHPVNLPLALQTTLTAGFCQYPAPFIYAAQPTFPRFPPFPDIRPYLSCTPKCSQFEERTKTAVESVPWGRDLQS
jgi:hypothetical protein